MLKISDYSQQIDSLHEQGKSAYEISLLLGFKYPQPVYNYFRKKKWERKSHSEYRYKSLYDADKTFFQSINTEEKAYILGFICADGHIDKNRHCISIALKDSDFKLLEKIKKATKSSHPIKRKIKHSNPYKKTENQILYQCALNMSGKELVQPLIDMGLAGNKTYTLSSDIMNYIPEHLVQHFLRGYLDGDGNIFWGKKYSSGYKYSIQVCGNEDFLLGSFQKYFPSACSMYKSFNSKQCFVWKVTNKKEVLRFLNWIYGNATIYLDRKYDIFKYAMWSYKTELIAGNSFFLSLIEGQSAANSLAKCLREVQRLSDETIQNPYGDGSIEYNSDTNARHSELQNISE